MRSEWKTGRIILVAIVFIWIGFVCSISFMESWLKFQAPGVTINLGVGIGRIIFNALNKVELAMAFIVLASLLYGRRRMLDLSSQYGLIIALSVLAIQTLWFLPVMDERATLRLAGASVETSYLHFYYVGSEIIKIFGLTLFGIKHIQ